MKEHGIIVIGNSIANITCGALLANSGQDVLYIKLKDLEQTVGYFPDNCGDFPNCEFSFDYPSGIFYEIVKELKLEDNVLYEAELPLLHLITSAKTFVCEYNWDGYQNLLYREFEAEKEALEHYFSVIEKLNQEWIGMVMASGIPKLTQIMNIVKYSKIKYKEFIEKIFKNKLLISILKLDMVSQNVSMVVMAGYIMQLFHGKQLKAEGYRKLEESLISIINEKAKSIEVCTDNLTYGYSDKNKYFMVKAENKDYISNALIMSGDVQNKFDIDTSMGERGHNIYINACLKEAKSGCKKIYKFNTENHKNDGNQINYFCTAAERDGKMQLRIKYYQTVEDTNFLVHHALNYIQDISGQIDSYTLVSETEINSHMGWKCGQIDAWSYSPEEFQQNPLTIKQKTLGLYLTGDMGRAFLTAAKVTAKKAMEDTV